MSSRAVAKLAEPGEAHAREINRLTTLLEVGQALSATLDLRAGVGRVLQILRRHHGAARSTVVLLDEETGEVTLEAADGADDVQGQRLTRISAPIAIENRLAGVIGVELQIETARDPRTIKFLGLVGSLIAGAAKIHGLIEADRQRLIAENAHLRHQGMVRTDVSKLIGTSGPMRQVCRRISQVARTNATVLLRGEAGTGRALIAQAIHDQSSRAARPFVKLSCAGLPPDLVESELFGAQRGSVKGIVPAKSGRIEAAAGSTLFIDEIGDLQLSTQLKLLGVLRGESDRAGGSGAVRANVRLVAATNKDLERAMVAGTFHDELYDRVTAVTIAVPPLRERRPDILLLANHFLDTFARDRGKNVRRISMPAIDLLTSYHWPGNVQELTDVIEHAVVRCDGQVVHAHHLPPTLQPSEALETAKAPSLRQVLEAVERDALADALKSAGGNRARAARLLATTERIFNYRVRKYGIDWKRFRARSR